MTGPGEAYFRGGPLDGEHFPVPDLGAEVIAAPADVDDPNPGPTPIVRYRRVEWLYVGVPPGQRAALYEVIP